MFQCLAFVSIMLFQSLDSSCWCLHRKKDLPFLFPFPNPVCHLLLFQFYLIVFLPRLKYMSTCGALNQSTEAPAEKQEVIDFYLLIFILFSFLL